MECCKQSIVNTLIYSISLSPKGRRRYLKGNWKSSIIGSGMTFGPVAPVADFGNADGDDPVFTSWPITKKSFKLKLFLEKSQVNKNIIDSWIM